MTCFVKALSGRLTSQDPSSIYFVPILCEVGQLAMREKGTGTFEDGTNAALAIVKHMPSGLTLWLNEKEDGSERSSYCSYVHIASGLRIVIEATRLDIGLD